MKKTSSPYIIYKATSPNGKQYIGITGEPLQTRIHKHFYQSTRTNSKFANALKLYKKDIKWEILKSDLSQSLAIKYEIYYIKFFNTYKKGYNSTKGGEGAFGYKWDKDLHRVYHNIRVNKFYKNKEFKNNQSRILKDYYRNNPKHTQKNINNLKKWRKETFNQDYEKKRLISIRTSEARLKNSISNGSEEFNVYDFIKKQYIGTWINKADCQRELSLSKGKISDCIYGKRNFHKTYIFKLTIDKSVIDKQFNEEWLVNIKRKPHVITNK